MKLINNKKVIRNQNIPASYLILKREDLILLLRRFNTGYKDGQYSLVAGHVDFDETFTDALIREAREESGLIFDPNQIKTVHVMHRKSDTDGSQRVDVFHLVENFEGEPKNLELEKCDELAWFHINKLPKNVIPYIREAINNFQKGIFYSEYGWK
ncbi:MAG: NUDIX domain-containing protein [Pseudomonadales bacterium]|nr:NUDIX domain-containing protein [Pseudomonadales bacterium]